MPKPVFDEVYEGLPFWDIQEDIVEMIVQSDFPLKGKRFRVTIEQVDEDE